MIKSMETPGSNPVAAQLHRKTLLFDTGMKDVTNGCPFFFAMAAQVIGDHWNA